MKHLQIEERFFNLQVYVGSAARCKCAIRRVGKPRCGLSSGQGGSCQSHDSPSPPPKIKKTNISAP
jgi:hypothetical protein